MWTIVSACIVPVVIVIMFLVSPNVAELSKACNICGMLLGALYSCNMLPPSPNCVTSVMSFSTSCLSNCVIIFQTVQNLLSVYSTSWLCNMFAVCTLHNMCHVYLAPLGYYVLRTIHIIPEHIFFHIHILHSHISFSSSERCHSDK